MRKKLVINIDGVKTTRIAKIEGNIIKYKEAGNVYVSIFIGNDTLQIIKKGDINFDFTHKLDETRFLDFTLFLNGQTFSGKNKVKTTKLKINPSEINLDFIRDGDLIKSSYKLLN